VRGLAAAGFGFVEVGSVSAHPSAGNPRPRLFRLPADEAIVVNYGVPNDGAEVVARTLRANLDIRIVLGTGQADTEAAGRAIERHFPNRGYFSAGFDMSPTTLRLIQEGHIRCTVDQQPYIQGFYPVMQLVLYLRYGIVPSDIDAGAAIIDKANVDQVMALSQQLYR